MNFRRGILVLGLAASFAMVEAAPASANIFKDGARFVKKTTKKVGRAAGGAAKDVGRAVGKTAKGAGRATGKAVREVRGFVGDVAGGARRLDRSPVVKGAKAWKATTTLGVGR